MSKGLLTVLTVVEIVALVAILAVYLLIVAKQLRSIAATLSEVTWGARAVERVQHERHPLDHRRRRRRARHGSSSRSCTHPRGAGRA